MSKVEEYEAKLKEHAEKREAEAKIFSVDEVLVDADKIEERFVPELGCVVRYGRVTLGDLAEINKAKTDEERAIRTLWLMLRKADANITLEKVERIPLETATAILTAVFGRTPLQRTGKP